MIVDILIYAQRGCEMSFPRKRYHYACVPNNSFPIMNDLFKHGHNRYHKVTKAAHIHTHKYFMYPFTFHKIICMYITYKVVSLGNRRNFKPKVK